MSQNQSSSHCRIVRTKGDPSKHDETVRLWTREILPLLKKQKGFGGATLLGNRKTGEGLTLSYWDSETAMKDARGQVRPDALNTLAKTGGRIMEDDECEVVLLERFQPARSGVWVRLTTMQGDPAQGSQAASRFKDRIVPTIKDRAGARAAYFFVNRQTGKTFAGCVWDTQQDLQRSEASLSELRADATNKFGGREAKTEALEMYFTEILTPAALVH